MPWSLRRYHFEWSQNNPLKMERQTLQDNCHSHQSISWKKKIACEFNHHLCVSVSKKNYVHSELHKLQFKEWDAIQEAICFYNQYKFGRMWTHGKNLRLRMSAPCPLNPVLPGGVLLFMLRNMLIILMFCQPVHMNACITPLRMCLYLWIDLGTLDIFGSLDTRAYKTVQLSLQKHPFLLQVIFQYSSRRWQFKSLSFKFSAGSIAL